MLRVRSYRRANIESDHFLVGVKFRCRILDRSSKSQNKTRKFNIENLRNAEILEAYQTKLDERLSNISFDAQTVDINWENVQNAIKKTAEEIIGYRAGIKKRRLV